ncbi:MAG: hypothetical protein D6730_24850 [Bacteroidetes bacterium]|nr:MAG: hypothetical protein D6730_24850 [Bacteroidota bacterium]
MKEFEKYSDVDLNKTPKLKAAGKRHPFQVPEGYFEQLPQRIRLRIAAENEDEASLMEQAPILSSIEKKEVFEVPEGYFSELPQRLMSTEEVAGEEEETGPILSGIEKANVFRAPEGYFEQLPATISAKLAGEPPARIRPLWQRVRRLPAAYALSAAAVVLLLLGLFWFLPSRQHADWEQIPTEELLSVIETEDVDIYALAEVLGPEGLNNIELYGPDASLDGEDLDALIDELDWEMVEDELLLQLEAEDLEHINLHE